MSVSDFVPGPGRTGEDAVLDFVLRELEGCDSFLDAGCNVGKYTLRLQSWRKFKNVVALDAHAPSLDQVVADQKILGPLPEALDQVGLVDAVICLDVIEHLTKAGAMTTLRGFEACATKKIIVFTPKGFQHQPEDAYNPWMEHLSGWEAAEFEALGYEVSVWRDFNYGRGNVGDALWAVKSLP